MIRFSCGVLVVVLVAGCGDPAAKLQSKTIEIPSWGALDKLRSEEVMRPVENPAANNDWAGVKAGLVSDAFKAAVEEFASAPIPSKFATEQRKAAKEEAAKKFQALIEAAGKNAPDAEIKAGYEAAMSAFQEVGKADGGGK